MSVMAYVENGQLVESASAASLSTSSTTTSSSSSTVDKEQFLQLLVAEMQYQDPLEPVSNTEYISQYATFAELEQMQNMTSTLDLTRASSLIGQTVMMQITGSTGNTTMIQGAVDYVVYENSKAYLAINGDLYSMDDLYMVIDDTYIDAYNAYVDFNTLYDQLPATTAAVTLTDKDTIEAIYEMWNTMTTYQKTFFATDYTDELQEYMDALNILIDEADEAGETTDTEVAEEEAATDTETEDVTDTDIAEEVQEEEGTPGIAEEPETEESEDGTEEETVTPVEEV